MTNLFDIKGKKAIVTGGIKGLGYGIAEGYLEAGAQVVIVGTSDKVYDVAPQFIPTIKKAMVLRGIEMEPVCAQPLLPATEAETEEIRRILKEGHLV